MGFDEKGFMNAKCRHRTAVVPVPELSAFFGEDENPEFTVRSLSGEEYGRVLDAVNEYRAEDVRALVASVSGGETEKIVEGLKDFLTTGKKRMPDDVIRRSYLIEYGVDSPKLSHETVMKIRKHSAEVFYRLSEKIKSLTGMGSELGKSKNSGKTKG